MTADTFGQKRERCILIDAFLIDASAGLKPLPTLCISRFLATGSWENRCERYIPGAARAILIGRGVAGRSVRSQRIPDRPTNSPASPQSAGEKHIDGARD